MDEKKLDELLTLTRENNKILRGMRRAQIWTTILHTIYWFIILGGLVGSYYFLQPYINQYMETFQKLMKTYNELQSAGKGGLSDMEQVFGRTSF